jgi:hypothetical protein
LLAGFIAWLDSATGPDINFPILFLFPVALAAWFNGGRWAAALALALPAIRLLFWEELAHPVPMAAALANIGIDTVVLIAFGQLIDRNARLTRNLEQEVETLRGLLPICAYCKKVRVGEDSWMPLDRYVAEHSSATFSHGLCQECLDRHYGDEKEGGLTQ